MRSIAADLQQYLLYAADRKFEWGSHDCCTFVAEWCEWRNNTDPYDRWRGTYDSEDGARLIIGDAHGLQALWELGMINAAIPEADEPQIGDVGIVRIMGEHGEDAVGAIYQGRRWAMLSPNGLFCASIAPEHVAKVWRVG